MGAHIHSYSKHAAAGQLSGINSSSLFPSQNRNVRLTPTRVEDTEERLVIEAPCDT